MKITFLIILFFNAQLIISQDLSHNSLNIPEDLKANAYAIYRLDDTQINLNNPYKMTITIHQIVTVLNKSGNNYAHINVYYDNHSSIKSIKATIYNVLGLEIKKVKSNDIKDYSASSDNLYSDDRVKNYEYIPLNYPYTIDYETIVESENTAFYPRWYPIKGYYASTQESHFTVNYPANELKINISEKKFDTYILKNTSTSGHIDYRAENIKVIEPEPYSPSFSNFAPMVLLAPNKFNLSGVYGEANNWEEFGSWMYSNLLLGRDQLSEQTKSEIKNLVNGIDDPIERARKVYAYMQNKTRYISVQIGIGGWKPMRADEVDHLKYGDCKALVNYTQALLKEANVNTYYTLVYANDKKNIDKDFVAMQGNHAILFFPTQKDTIWLECTTQKRPFGYMGDFTADRDVLLIKPDGGKITHTKVYNADESYQNSFGTYHIDDNGYLKGSLTIESSGVQFDNHFQIADEPKEAIIKYYKSYFSNINNLSIINFENKTDDLANKFTESVTIEAENYGQKSGDRILLILNAFNRSSEVPNRMKNRLLPIEIDYGFIDRDVIQINLPKNYKIEALPASEKIDSEFGSYHSEVIKLNDSTLTYKRTFILKQNNYPKESYDAFRNFKKDVVLKDNSKTILIKNNL